MWSWIGTVVAEMTSAACLLGLMAGVVRLHRSVMDLKRAPAYLIRDVTAILILFVLCTVAGS